MKSQNDINKEKFNKRNAKRLRRDNARSTQKINESLNLTYKKWQAVSDIKRSFFVYSWTVHPSPKEIEIIRILNSTNLRFYREVSFDLKKRFDFYIPLIDLVIEYDGAQHFKNLKEIENDKKKELILRSLGVKYIRYNKTHDLEKQIKHDLVHHPVLKK